MKSLSPRVLLCIRLVRISRRILELLKGQIPENEWRRIEEIQGRAEQRVALMALTENRR